MKIIIVFLCENLSMLTNSIIYVERNYNSLLNVIISFGPIPFFLFFTRMLYIWKVVISKTTVSECGWSIIGSHKLSSNSNLNAFFGWTVTENFLLVWWMSTVILVALCILLSHLLPLIPQLVLNNVFSLIWLDIDFILSGYTVHH